jgi:hypothetical protein
MRLDLRRWFATVMLGTAALTSSSIPARAALTIQLSAGGNAPVTVADATSSGYVGYSNSSLFGGLFSVQGLFALSNSLTNGPGVISELISGANVIQNLTGSDQTLTITIGDTGFEPDAAIRPLQVYGTASATFYGLKDGTLSFQTYASDSNTLLQTTGGGIVFTDPVTLLPNSAGDTAVTSFTPQNPQFSVTDVITIDLSAHASVGFNGDSLVHAPEPGTAALALSGTLALAVGLWCRRCRRVA